MKVWRSYHVTKLLATVGLLVKIAILHSLQYDLSYIVGTQMKIQKVSMNEPEVTS